MSDAAVEQTCCEVGSYECAERIDLPDGASFSVDKCIAPLVEALNAGGMTTIASCCGHGETAGTVLLSDDTVLFVTRRTGDGIVRSYPIEAGESDDRRK